VTWRKLGENHFLSVGDQTWVKDPNLQLHYNEITADVTEWNLVIRNATEEHSGTYECRISDSKQLIRYVDLNVTGIPVAETATIPPIAVSGKNYVDRGQAIHLFCNTTGPIGAHLKIDWFKDGDRIDYRSYRQVVITNYNLVEKNVLVSELLIDRSQETDTGTYICRSASGHIESIKVTVLLADTNNVKRGYASNRESSSAPSRQCLQHIVLIAVFLSSSLVS
ncbi:carcinoembryonic antigen-related cell adhesion molecule 20, partial [Biomphalaria glabrata]